MVSVNDLFELNKSSYKVTKSTKKIEDENLKEPTENKTEDIIEKPTQREKIEQKIKLQRKRKLIHSRCVYQNITEKKVKVKGCGCRAFIVDCQSKDVQKTIVTTKDCSPNKCRFFKEEQS
jgi:hypothetical protein